jgi:hypothetical protein
VNCTVLQRRLLSADQPEQPPADLQSHLAECPSCRAWQRRLVQMERHIPLLPVPPSNAKAQLLQRLLGPRPGETERPPIADPSTLWRAALAPGPKERGLRKLSLAFALAASLLVFALAWWSWPHAPGPASDLTLREQARLDERLTNSLHGDTPHDRVLRLAKLAEEVQGEARTLVDHSERLEQWARFYSRVVSEHLIEQARQLPADERTVVLEKVASGLRQAESDATRLATQLKTAAPRSAASFQEIALASRKGERDLRALLRG